MYFHRNLVKITPEKKHPDWKESWQCNRCLREKKQNTDIDMRGKKRSAMISVVHTRDDICVYLFSRDELMSVWSEAIDDRHEAWGAVQEWEAARRVCRHPACWSVSFLAVLPQPVDTLSCITDHRVHTGCQAQRAHNCVQLWQHTWNVQKYIK